jgi:hypothetical protein
MNVKGRKPLLISLAVLAGLILLRSGGCITTELYQFHYQARVYRNSSMYAAGANGIDTQKRSTITSHNEGTTTAQQWGFSLKPDFGGDSSSVSGVLTDDLRNSLKNVPRLAVSIDTVEMEGTYWPPLIKSGRCTYEVSMSGRGPDGAVHNSIINGAMDFSVQGLCSQAELRRRVATTISQDTLKQIEDTMKE